MIGYQAFFLIRQKLYTYVEKPAKTQTSNQLASFLVGAPNSR